MLKQEVIPSENALCKSHVKECFKTFISTPLACYWHWEIINWSPRSKMLYWDNV